MIFQPQPQPWVIPHLRISPLEDGRQGWPRAASTQEGSGPEWLSGGQVGECRACWGPTQTSLRLRETPTLSCQPKPSLGSSDRKDSGEKAGDQYGHPPAGGPLHTAWQGGVWACGAPGNTGWGSGRTWDCSHLTGPTASGHHKPQPNGQVTGGWALIQHTPHHRASWFWVGPKWTGPGRKAGEMRSRVKSWEDTQRK